MLEEILNTQSFYEKAKKILPSDIFSFIDSGSHDELALQRNRKIFDNILISPRILMGLEDICTEVELFNHKIDFPLLIAPAAYQKLLSKEGELDMLKAAEAFNTIFIVSMFSSVDYELIAQNKKKPVWLQMYFLKDREINKKFIHLANKLNFEALVVTVDAPIYGKKERERANPIKFPANLSFPHLKKLGIFFEDYLKNKRHFSSLLDQSIHWKDIAWLAENTDLPIILKGVIDPRDTEIALTYPNVKGIIISNHGGRQLDSSYAPIEVIHEHKKIVNDKVKLFLDGGIARGSDIFKALALGADATLIGRTALWALSVAGSEGVFHALSILKNELIEIMTLSGCSNIKNITKEFISN